MADPFDPRNVTLGLIKEFQSDTASGSFGVTPSPAVVQKIPFQSWSLKQPTDTIISQTIRSGRAPIDLLRTSVRGEASLGFEMIATAYDDLWEMSLMSANWTTQVQKSAAAAVTMVTSTNTLNDASASFSGLGFVKNQWIHVSGASGPTVDQNGFYKIGSVTASKLTIAPAFASDATGTITVTQGPYLENSNVLRSYMMEQRHAEGASFIHKHGNGLSVNEATLNVAIGEIVNGTFTMLGTAIQATNTSPAATGSTAASTNKPMTAVDHVAAVRELEGTSMVDLEILGMDLTINNNLAVREIVGTLGPAKRHRADLFEVSGTVRIYMTDQVLMNLFYNFTDWNVALILLDGAGNAYVFDVPAVKFSDVIDDVAGGQDLIVELPFSAFEDAAEGVAMRIARFTSVP